MLTKQTNTQTKNLQNNQTKYIGKTTKPNFMHIILNVPKPYFHFLIQNSTHQNWEQYKNPNTNQIANFYNERQKQRTL